MPQQVWPEDEAFTYNKRISRMSIIQEYRMILKAIEKGTPEERIARALNVHASTIRSKRRPLAGICSEVEEMFKDRQVPINVFTELRKMKSVRHVEAAVSMIKMNRITNDQARFLVAATPASKLVEGKAKPKELTAEQMRNKTNILIRRSNTVRRFAKRVYGEGEIDHDAAYNNFLASLPALDCPMSNNRIIMRERFAPRFLRAFIRVQEKV